MTVISLVLGFIFFRLTPPPRLPLSVEQIVSDPNRLLTPHGRCLMALWSLMTFSGTLVDLDHTEEDDKEKGKKRRERKESSLIYMHF